jgi:hypothetical protein
MRPWIAVAYSAPVAAATAFLILESRLLWVSVFSLF